MLSIDSDLMHDLNLKKNILKTLYKYVINIFLSQDFLYVVVFSTI